MGKSDAEEGGGGELSGCKRAKTSERGRAAGRAMGADS